MQLITDPQKKRRQRWIRVGQIATGMLIGMSLSMVSIEPVEFFLYDRLVRWSASPLPSGQIQTVAIDETTLDNHLGYPSADQHADVVQKILGANPLAVVYLFDPSEVSGQVAARKKFADRLSRDQRVRFGLDDLPAPERLDLLLLAPPFDRVRVEPAPFTADRLIFGKDGVTRRLITRYGGGAVTAHSELALEARGPLLKSPRGAFNFIDTEQVLIRFQPANTFVPISFTDLIQADANLPPDLAERFRGKIVLIGNTTLDSTANFAATPLQNDPSSMSRLEVHANMLDTLIRDSGPQRLGTAFRILATATFAALTVFTILNAGPLIGLTVILASILAYLGLAFVLFYLSALWLPIGHPLLAAFICYYFFIPYRLIAENRRSWEYYERNKLLTKVEELKSNFMRMMSHDLRTPLARIQGMAHMAIADRNPLSPTQKRAMESISESSQELSEFIGSILSLGRIESQEVKLHARSQDLNQLLSDVVRKCADLAHRRQVTIRTELEPMFSIRIDADLIRQVITNLVENAIKYSPEGSSILVSSEEIGDFARIQVADQGPGISREDLPFIFDKFFRSQSARQSDKAGSGLGLYLARYFVELHHGQIDVESEQGQGTTFTVTLPMQSENQKRSLPKREFEGHA